MKKAELTKKQNERHEKYINAYKLVIETEWEEAIDYCDENEGWELTSTEKANLLKKLSEYEIFVDFERLVGIVCEEVNK